MKALIVGVTGQDGAYLARYLLAQGHEVVGTTRDVASADRRRMRALGVDESVRVLSMLPADYRSVLHTMSQVRPEQVFFWRVRLRWACRLISRWRPSRALPPVC